MKYRKMILGAGIVGTLCSFLLIRRGFRASDTPSTFETVIDRAVRNYSILRRERHQQNPLMGDSAALQQGLEMFFARCATCHAIDGSGLIAIGVNL